MTSLLIVELTSTQIRFLKLHKSSKMPILPIQSLKFNKKITNNIKNIEVQRIDTVIKNTLKKASFNSINRENWLFYRSESFPPMVLNDIGPNYSQYLAKKVYFSIKAKTLPNEVKLIFYDGFVYISYWRNDIFFFKTFLHAAEIEKVSSFNEIFSHRLSMFDLPKDADFITVIIDESFKIRPLNLTFLKDYFLKASLKRFFIPFIEYLYGKA